MGKIPYVLECELFVKAEIKHAEELLAEYNDFYLYNLAHYSHIAEGSDQQQRVSHHHHVGQNNEVDELDEEKRLAIAEHNAKVATDHFALLFGSKDFGASSMVGFRPSWYDLQQILLEEFKHKTHIKESAMNGIAPALRNVASVMLYAERVVSELEKLNVAPEFMAPIKEGFELLFERVRIENIDVPEYYKNRAQFNKLKKTEQYLEFCKSLFFKE